MLKKSLFLFLLCVLLDETLSQRNPYCAAGLCPNGKKHIACGNNGRFAAICPNNAFMIRIAIYRNLIVNLHNNKRNLIASGRLVRYQAARRMGTMQWDRELSRLAALNVKQCRLQHDKCRNTKRFSRSGQNLWTISYTGRRNRKSNAALIRKAVNAWWSEHRNCNMRIINNYPKNYNGPAIGHFTVLVAEKNIRVGCAASRFTKGRKNIFLMACNYATTNIFGEPIYISGNAGRECRTGRNPKYPYLCSKREFYAGLK